MRKIDFRILNKPILGKDLSLIYPKYMNIVYPNYVSDTPGIALQKINNHFKDNPTINGNNIAGIVEIRNQLFNLSKESKYINSFAIVASHTHWIDRKPIIYKYFKSQNKYIIGTHKIKPNAIYYPVSFAFNKEFPLSFEWFEGLNINIDEFKIAYEIIENLNIEIQNMNYPFGISIDFRFKNSIFEEPLASVELPIDEIEDEFYGFSKIATLDYFASNKNGEETEQVAWHPFSDKLLDLNETELEILNNLRDHISKENNNLALEKLNNISKILKKGGYKFK